MHIRAVIALVVVGAGCHDTCEPQPGSPDADCVTPITSQGETCSQPGVEFEPNDNTSQANVVPPASAVTQSFEGSIGRSADMFVTTGPQPSGDRLPTAHITYDSDRGKLRLCMFVACTVGKTGLVSLPEDSDAGTPCPLGGVASKRPEGMLGCCTTGTSVSVSVTCDAKSAPTPVLAKPNFRAHFEIDRIEPDDTCLKYAVAYQF